MNKFISLCSLNYCSIFFIFDHISFFTKVHIYLYCKKKKNKKIIIKRKRNTHNTRSVWRKRRSSSSSFVRHCCRHRSRLRRRTLQTSSPTGSGGSPLFSTEKEPPLHNLSSARTQLLDASFSPTLISLTLIRHLCHHRSRLRRRTRLTPSPISSGGH